MIAVIIILVVVMITVKTGKFALHIAPYIPRYALKVCPWHCIGAIIWNFQSTSSYRAISISIIHILFLRLSESDFMFTLNGCAS